MIVVNLSKGKDALVGRLWKNAAVGCEGELDYVIINYAGILPGSSNLCVFMAMHRLNDLFLLINSST